ncbi:hypothetical protein V1527DRAFT_416271, partial [Lipomyces starkeyi]
ILRQKYGIVNRLTSSRAIARHPAIIPQAINLLSLRPNGSFLSYLKLTHITAGVRYGLRSVLLYSVIRLMSEDQLEDEAAIDGEITQYFSPHQSTAFSCCVQVHAACNSFGLSRQLPTVAWATDDFTSLRRNSGTLLSLTLLKDFLRDV